MERVGYINATQAAGVLAKTGPAGLHGFTVTASTAATITIYDNTSAAGAVLFTKSSLAVGEVVTFGNFGIAAKNGLYIVVGGTGTVNVFYV